MSYTLSNMISYTMFHIRYHVCEQANVPLQPRVMIKDLHDYLARRFRAWYTKYKPSSSAVVSAGDPELGAVVQVEGVDGAAQRAKRYSLTLNDDSAAPCAAQGAPGPAAPAAADEGGEDAAHKVGSG